MSWTVYAHAGDGELHIRPFLDMADPLDVAMLEPMAGAVLDAALELGGSISGEHGCGLARTQFLRRQSGDLYHAFREIKDAFDPYNVFNPGKVVGDDPHLMTRHLKPLARVEPDTDPDLAVLDGYSDLPSDTNSTVVELATPAIVPALRHGALSVLEQASACNGCGACRSQDPALRMCPSFRALRTEAASPRNQANLLRQIATGAVDPRLWGSEEMKANADLCIHCMACRTECPAGGRHLQPDGRGQGRLCRDPRPRPDRLVPVAGRPLGQDGQPVPDPLERHARRRRGPVAGRADLRPLPAPLPPPGPPDLVPQAG